MLFDAGRSLLLDFIFAFALIATLRHYILLLGGSDLLGGLLQVLRLQLGLWVTRGCPPPQRGTCLFGVVVVNQRILLVVEVTACLRQWFVVNLRLFVKEALLVGIFLHFLEVSNAVFDFGLHMIISTCTAHFLIPPLRIVVIEAHCIFVSDPSKITSVVVLRPLYRSLVAEIARLPR